MGTTGRGIYLPANEKSEGTIGALLSKRHMLFIRSAFQLEYRNFLRLFTIPISKLSHEKFLSTDVLQMHIKRESASILDKNVQFESITKDRLLKRNPHKICITCRQII